MDEFGVLHQKHRENFVYDASYVKQHYVPIQSLVMQMSYLRLGYVLGAMDQTPTSVLDVGYGSGNFLEVCDAFKIRTTGCDLFPDYLPACSNFVSDPCEGVYDLITFYDSLEHFPSLDFVQHLHTQYVAISVPWCHEPNNPGWFLNWKHRRPNEHLHHFNAASLVRFMDHAGFVCVNSCNLEDVIRKSQDHVPNILSAVFKRK